MCLFLRQIGVKACIQGLFWGGSVVPLICRFVSMDAQEQQYDVTALENEDEFEEFEVEEWDRKEEDPENEELWEQDWDDDAVNDDFSQKLKAMVSQ